MSTANSVTLQDLRCYAVARSLFAPTTLPRALARLGFVQADPIRAPARAQDLTLRLRVTGYRAGDLERRYARLGLEEDFFINYGFVPRATHHLMQPREPSMRWSPQRLAQANAILAYVRERGTVHPRDVDARFQQGKARNWFGGSSRASTQLLDDMHYRGMLRVAGRDGGTRLFAVREAHAPVADPDTALDRLVDVAVNVYAPLPERSLSELVMHLRHGVPQWETRRRAALARAKTRLPQAQVEGLTWYWPQGEDPTSGRHQSAVVADRLCLLAPFDPVVWDRRRFELFWGWPYRFEAYTPAPKRQRGYYALPLLWHEQVIGWANVALREGRLEVQLGYVAGRPPRGGAFRAALEEEKDRLHEFLRAPAVAARQ